MTYIRLYSNTWDAIRRGGALMEEFRRSFPSFLGLDVVE
jgi:hypothetical protein